MSETLLKTEKRALRYDFSATEIHELAQQLAKKNMELQEVENEKKSVVSSYAAKINETKAKINVLSGQVSNGWEMRDIECEILYNTPQPGKKTIIRKDNGKKTAIEAMTDFEWNLFNQPKEAEDSIPETEDAEFEVSDEDSGPKLLGN